MADEFLDGFLVPIVRAPRDYAGRVNAALAMLPADGVAGVSALRVLIGDVAALMSS